MDGISRRPMLARWSRRMLAVLGSLVALGVGYAAAAGGIGSITVFSTGLPGNFNGYVPGGIAAGSDGALWFSGGNTNPSPLIARITPTGTISEFNSGLAAGNDPEAMTAGPDGNVWFTDVDFVANAIGRISPDGTITEFPVAENGRGLKGIAGGPDGNVWFTNGGLVGKITPSGQISEYSNGLGPFPQLFGITAGPDNSMWFVDAGSPSAIGKITPDGTITEYKATGGIILNSLSGIAQGPDGNLWFTEARAVVRMTPSGQFTVFPTNLVPSFLSAIAPGPDGNLWFTDEGTDELGMVTPAGVVSEFDLSASGLVYASWLTTGPDGDLWLTGGPFGAPSIAKVDVGARAASVSPPSITGSGQVGDEQSCGGAVWADWAGQQPSTSASTADGYQWLLDGDPLAGQTAQVYTPAPTDAGHLLSCRVVATYTLFGTTVSATSTAVALLPRPGGGGGGVVPATTTTTTTTSPTTTTTTATQPVVVKKAAATVTVVGLETIHLGTKKPVLRITLKVAKTTEVVFVLLAPNGKTVARWSVRLEPGTRHLALALPAKARHKGRDVLHIQAGNSKTTTIAVSIRP